MRRPRAVLAALLLAAGAALAQLAPPATQAAPSADSPLGVEVVGGSVIVDHLGSSAALKPGDRLQERDVIRTSGNSRLSLRLARLGVLELGPDTEIGVEKLPAMTANGDRKSIFSLARGYFRVQWEAPAGARGWPFFVYFGGQRAGLVAGEYFFDQRESATRLCVAAGRIAVVPVTGANLDTLLPPSCSKLYVEAAPETLARVPEDWPAVRRDYTIDASARSATLPAPLMQSMATPAAEATPAAAIAPTPAAANPVGAAAATTTPAAPPVSTPPTTAGGRWTLNVASLPDAAAAARQIQVLQNAGYAATAQAVEVRGQTWHRVQLRGLASAEDARAKAAEIDQKLGLRNAWIVREP